MIKAVFLLGFLSLLSTCQKEDVQDYTYKIPECRGDGLEVAHLKEVGLDSGKIIKAIGRIEAGKYGQIHSMLIYKNSKLVLDEYFPGNRYNWSEAGFYGEWVSWGPDMLHHLHSDTKSITSLCIGIAIDKGFIKDVHQSIFQYLPDHQQYREDGKAEITIEHLLSMSSGLEWTEWGKSYKNQGNPIIGIWFSDKDPVSFILEGELKYSPGSHFSYFGGHQILLGEILRNAAGMDIASFSKTYLFDPLGIDEVQWAVQFENGVFEAASGLKMKPRDMIKVGALILNEGNWKGAKIISSEWLSFCATAYTGEKAISVPGEDVGNVGYSYSWWTKTLSFKDSELDILFALGYGGQKIIIIPGMEVVVTFTGGNYNGNIYNFEILEDFILPEINGLSQ